MVTGKLRFGIAFIALVISVTVVKADEWTWKSREDLTAAVRRGDLAAVRSLLDQGLPVGGEPGGDANMSTLHLAVKHGRTDVLKLLLERGANPDVMSDVIVTEDGEEFMLPRSPLHVAAQLGRLEMIELLAAANGNLNIRGTHVGDAHDQTNSVEAGSTASPSEVAKHYGQMEAFALLYQLNAERDNLVRLVEKGDVEAVREQLAQGGDPNQWDHRGWSMMHYAAQGGSIPMFAMLVEHGGDLQRPTSVGNAPLHFAAWKGHRDLVAWLLERGARVRTHTRAGKWTGWTPLHVALLEKHKAVVQLLLDHNARVGPVKPGWPAPLHAAAQGGDPELIRLLVERGAEVNTEISHTRRDEQNFTDYIQRGLTPLDVAVREGRLEAAKVLLALGANSNTFFDDYHANDDGGFRYGITRWTPLMVAAAEDNVPMVKLLLDRGASLLCRGWPKPPWGFHNTKWTDVFEVAKDNVRPLLEAAKQATIDKARPLENEGRRSGHAVMIQGVKAFVSATSELRSRRHPETYSASKAFDGDLDTAWVEGVGAPQAKPVSECGGTALPEKEQGLTIRFSQEQILRGFVLYPGYMKSPSLFQQNLIPRRIRIELDGEPAGEYELRYIEQCMQDVAGHDAYSVPAADKRNLSPKVILFPQPRAAQEVALRIVAAVGGTRFRDLAISEWRPILQGQETRIGSINLEPVIRVLEQVRSFQQEENDADIWPPACNPVQLVGWQSNQWKDLAPQVRDPGKNISWFGPKAHGAVRSRFREQLERLGENQRDASAAYYFQLTEAGWVDQPVSVMREDDGWRLVGSRVYWWGSLPRQKTMYPLIVLDQDFKATELSAQFKASDNYCFFSALPPMKPEHQGTVSDFCRRWVEAQQQR